MNPALKYEIQFSGLQNGDHEFEWDLEPTFFDGTTAANIDGISLKLKVLMKKSERMLGFEFFIDGTVETYCDHCGDPVSYPLQVEQELVVRFANEPDLNGDDVVFIAHSDYKFDLQPHIFDFVLLALPARIEHEEGGCNEVVDEYLVEKPTQNNESDPRWKALEQLKNKV